MRRATWLLLALAACDLRDGADVRLVDVARGGRPALAVETGREVRISARAVPVLELEDGRLVRFEHGQVTSDGAYFTEAPWVARPVGLPPGGILRVSLCRERERVCSIVVRPVRLGREPPTPVERT